MLNCQNYGRCVFQIKIWIFKWPHAQKLIIFEKKLQKKSHTIMKWTKKANECNVYFMWMLLSNTKAIKKWKQTRNWWWQQGKHKTHTVVFQTLTVSNGNFKYLKKNNKTHSEWIKSIVKLVVGCFYSLCRFPVLFSMEGEVCLVFVFWFWYFVRVLIGFVFVLAVCVICMIYLFGLFVRKGRVDEKRRKA